MAPSRDELAARGVEGERAEGDDLGRLAAAGDGAAQDGVDAQRQLRRLERLGHVIVGADGEAADAVFRHAARGQQHDRHFRGLAHAFGQREAVLDRHHHVEDEQVEIHGVEQLARAGGVGGGRDARAGLREIALEQFADAVVVVDQQQVRRPVERVEGGRGIHVRRGPAERRLAR